MSTLVYFSGLFFLDFSNFVYSCFSKNCEMSQNYIKYFQRNLVALHLDLRLKKKNIFLITLHLIWLIRASSGNLHGILENRSVITNWLLWRKRAIGFLSPKLQFRISFDMFSRERSCLFMS